MPRKWPRTQQEVLDEVKRLTDIVWYTRCFRPLELLIAAGLEEVPLDIQQGAEENARRIEKELAGQLGPFTDEEWGMILGKLSALGWMLGDDWDCLDT